MSVISDAITHPEPTPRTDALVFPNGCFSGNLLEHARCLERENIKLRSLIESMLMIKRPTPED